MRKLIKYTLITFLIIICIAFIDMAGLFHSNYPVRSSGADTFVEPRDNSDDVEAINSALDEMEFNEGVE